MSGHVAQRWRALLEMEPAHEQGARSTTRLRRRLLGLGVLLLFDLNEAVIERVRPDRPVLWSTDPWPWIERVRAAVPAIEAELDAFRRSSSIPTTATLAGMDDDGRNVPVESGTWRSLSLRTPRGWLEGSRRRFPATVAAFDGVPALANVGFSIVEPHSHVAAHRDPNGGALRLQVPLVVPGPSGSSRLRVADDIIGWEEGVPIVFDLAVDHEVWNDAEDDRVLLMAEISMPLPRPASWLNRIAQLSYRYHPSYRGMEARAEQALVATSRSPAGQTS